MPVLSYQVNAPGYGGINPKLVYIFTDDPVSTVTATGYIDWLANQQGIYTGDVALVVTRQTPTSVFAANFYEFQRVGMGPHWDLIPESGGTPPVDSVSGTLNEIIASPTTGNVVVSISPNPIVPGTGAINVPVGSTAQRAGAAGSLRFNSQIPQFEVTLDGINWIALQTGSASAVTSIIGTANEIVASSPTGNVTLSIASNAVMPGTAELTLPTGNTAQRGSTAGSIRFNNQIDVFETTVDGSTWLPIATGGGAVTSIFGTTNEIVASSSTGAVTLSIANNAVLPGTAEVVLPIGDTAQRGSTAGGLRFNNQLNEIELTNDGTNWYPVSTGNDTVNSVAGTAHRITVTGTNNAVVDIASDYVGQNTITTLGTVTTGTWNGTAVTVPYGGTGSTSFTANAPIGANSTTTGNLISLDTNIGNSGYVLTSQGASLPPIWSPAGGGALSVVSVPITAAQLQTIYATPIQILAAQGANTLIVVQSAIMEYDYNATFGGGNVNSPIIQYGSAAHGGGSGPITFLGNLASTMSNTINVIPGGTISQGSASAIINKGLYLSNSTSAYTGGGTGTFRFTVYYTVLTSTIV